MKRYIITALACTGLIATIGFAFINLHKDSEESEIVGKDFEWYKAYVDKYLYMDNVGLNIFRDGLTEEAKLYITWTKFTPTNYNSFSYDEINEVYKSLFEGNLPKENIENKKYCMSIYDYDEKDNTFKARPIAMGCGGTDPTPRYSSISKIEDFGNYFVAEVAFGKGELEESSYFVSNNTSFQLPLINNETVEIKCDYENCDNEFISRYSKLKKYYFTFTKKGDDYVLKDLSNTLEEKKQTIEPYVISFSRHPQSWYLENTENQIVADDNYNIFNSNGEIDDKIKIYMSIDKQNKYTDYLNANDNYEELTGEYLKKQNYSLDNCYDLEFQNRDELLSDEMGYHYESGAFKNKKAKKLDEWRKDCNTNKTGTIRISKVKSVTENNDGYIAEVEYLEASIKTNEETSEVWYELDLKNNKEKIECGYDKNSCKAEKVKKFFEENKQKVKLYTLKFNTNKEREVLKSIELIEDYQDKAKQH